MPDDRHRNSIRNLDLASSTRRSSDDSGRDETVAERSDRNLVELVQELRVGALGVQVLFGFLLSLPFFATKWRRLSHLQLGLYVTDLLLSAIATALLSGPVAYHRMVFRRHQKQQLVRAANAMAIGGLIAVCLAICGSVLLALSYVIHGVVVLVPVGLLLLVFIGLWFVLPFVRRDQPDY
jgi:O-antigen ligase